MFGKCIVRRSNCAADDTMISRKREWNKYRDDGELKSDISRVVSIKRSMRKKWTSQDYETFVALIAFSMKHCGRRNACANFVELTLGSICRIQAVAMRTS